MAWFRAVCWPLCACILPSNAGWVHVRGVKEEYSYSRASVGTEKDKAAGIGRLALAALAPEKKKSPMYGVL